MTKRTRKTFRGQKPRFRKPPEKKHGAIKRIVGDTPMKTLGEAAFETLVNDDDLAKDGDRFDAVLTHAKEPK